MSKYPSNGPSMSGVKLFSVDSGTSYRRPKKDRGQVWDWTTTAESSSRWRKIQREKLKRKREREKARQKKITKAQERQAVSLITEAIAKAMGRSLAAKNRQCTKRNRLRHELKMEKLETAKQMEKKLIRQRARHKAKAIAEKKRSEARKVTDKKRRHFWALTALGLEAAIKAESLSGRSR
jgi:hypothetical protein